MVCAERIMEVAMSEVDRESYMLEKSRQTTLYYPRIAVIRIKKVQSNPMIFYPMRLSSLYMFVTRLYFSPIINFMAKFVWDDGDNQAGVLSVQDNNDVPKAKTLHAFCARKQCAQ